MIPSRVKFVIIGAMLISIAVLVELTAHLKQENIRLAKNIENITKESSRELELAKGEYKNINAKWKTTLDSVISQYDIKLKNVRSATIIDVQYRDTGSVKLVYKPVERIDSLFAVPVAYSDDCWGVSGIIMSKDSMAKFELKERIYRSKVQILVIEKRRFIFWKKRQFRAFNNCGEMDVTDVKINR